MLGGEELSLTALQLRDPVNPYDADQPESPLTETESLWLSPNLEDPLALLEEDLYTKGQERLNLYLTRY
jgi:hypothetical protein